MKIPRHAQVILVLVAAGICSCTGLRAETSLQLGPSSGTSGSNLTVPLEFTSDDPVTAVQFDLLHAPGTAVIDSVRSGSAFNGHQIDYEAISDDLTRVVVISSTNQLLTDGSLVEIDLTLQSDVTEGSRSISFSNIILSDTTGTEVAVIWAPYVRITSPGEGQRFEESSQVGLSAVAIDYDGTITSVQFFVDGNPISLDTTAPYTATWSASGTGQAVLTAVAVASGGRQSTSPDVGILVGDSPYAEWRILNFSESERANPAISGPMADPEMDKLPNLLEYALGLNPKAVDMDDIPKVGLVDMGQETYTTLTYRANLLATDILFTVEVSGDGANWNSGAGQTEELRSEVIDGKREVETRDLQPVTGGSSTNRLMRLTVRLDEN